MRLEDDDRVVQFGLREVRYEEAGPAGCPQLRDDLTPDGFLAVSVTGNAARQFVQCRRVSNRPPSPSLTAASWSRENSRRLA